MCCSAWPAVFSKTITGTCEVLVDDKIQHVIWYQNRIGADVVGSGGVADAVFESVVQRAMPLDVWTGTFREPLTVNGITEEELGAELKRRRAGHPPQSLTQIRTPRKSISGGNCLIMPLLGSWESIRLLNTADTPNLLSDIDLALRLPQPRSRSWGQPTETHVSEGGGRMVFLQFDVYDIVIAERASQIANVLGQINPEKRPAVNHAVFDVLENWYKCPVAVCCFRSSDQAEAKPIGFAFQPTYADTLVVYTLDGHDGGPPDPNAMVQLDHTVFVGSFLTPQESSAKVHFSDSLPDHLSPYVLDKVMGMSITDRHMLNGDMIFDVAAVRAGHFNGLRKLPRFAPPKKATIQKFWGREGSKEERIIRTDHYANGNESLSGPIAL